MKPELYRKHLILKEYKHLKTVREDKIIDYCSALTRLTRITQNISPTPGHSAESNYDESVFELATKFAEIRAIDKKIVAIRRAVNDLPITECFVIRELYFLHKRASDIAKMIDKSKRSIFRIRNEALEHLSI